MNMTEWAENEVKLACAGEPDDEVLDKYAESCYQSALKAFKSLCEDGHSGMSIGFTLSILNRMVKHKPLTPVDGNDDEWHEGDQIGNRMSYQNKRCTSLFKNIYDDGHIEYSDVQRTTVYFGNNLEAGYHSGLASGVVDKLHPITMPYMPEERSYKIYCDVLSHEEMLDTTKDFELYNYTHLITPQGEREEVNKYIIIDKDGVREITKIEFEEKKKEVYKADKE